ncbi:MAG: Rnf-Nqr domain containing protein [Spirochaetia bacterium]
MTPRESPAAVLFLGLCPAIAVSARVIDALWMSAGVFLVFVLTGGAMALLSLGAGKEARGGPAAGWLRALVLTSFLTASFEAGLIALAPAASAALGIYAPLIAVNCLVLSAGTPDAPDSPLGFPGASLVRGVGFAASLVVIALIREAVSAGTITLFPVGGFGGTLEIPGLADAPVRALGLAGGALLCLGYFAAAAREIMRRAAAGPAHGGTAR